MLRQLMLFALVGAAGFVIDAGVLLVLIGSFGVNPYASRLLSFLTAATFTWRLNRTLTFRSNESAFRQWLLFLAANAGGGGLNLAIYSLLIATSAASPLAAAACGSLAGLFWNFFASRHIVFAAHRPALVRTDAPEIAPSAPPATPNFITSERSRDEHV